MEWIPDVAWDADIVPGDESGSSIINVTIQLKDFEGNNLTVCSCIYAYISDNSDGSTLAQDNGGTTPETVVIGTDGLLGTITTAKQFMLTSESDGAIDINITESGATDTFYLVLRMPNGKLVISDAITFAA